MASVTVIILTYNERLHIERAISAVRGFAQKVVVVDSFSTDGTVQLAESAGATVLQNPFINYSKQFQWALDNASIDTEWVMRLDADETIGGDLAFRIDEDLTALPESVCGISLLRKHIFLGRWISHGGRFPLKLLRIWRHGSGRIEKRWMDEHIVLTRGREVTFKGDFQDNNLNSLTFFTEKHNHYATREAIDVLCHRHNLQSRDGQIHSSMSSNQASRKRKLKEEFYNKMPFQFSAVAYFIYRYILQLGILDGLEGLIYHGLQGLWYRFLVGAKVLELDREIGRLSSSDAKVRRLGELTGRNLIDD